jgi:hypothetical protein
VGALGEPFQARETIQGFGILKPHGYPGDFEIIDRICMGYRATAPHLSGWDEYFRTRAAARAVRNRRDYFRSILEEILSVRPGRSLEVLSVGCGPARECAEVLRSTEAPLHIDLLDRDANALGRARELHREGDPRAAFLHGNAFRIRSAKRYDLIWSAGLFDYLDDPAFQTLAARLHGLIAAGGRLAIGNFDPSNPTRDYMEFGHWYLHHRSENSLMELSRGLPGSRNGAKVWVEREMEGVNSFLHIDGSASR